MWRVCLKGLIASWRGVTYIESRTHTIDSLKSLLSNRKLTESEQIRLMFQIGEEYNAYKVDSALIFYNRGYEMSKEHGNDSIRTRFAIKRANFMPLLLFITNAQSIMDSISEASVPKGMKAEYYDARRQMYNYISNFYSDYSEVYREYRDREIESQKALIKELDHETPQYRLNYAEHLFYSRKFDMAEGSLRALWRILMTRTHCMHVRVTCCRTSLMSMVITTGVYITWHCRLYLI